MFRNDAELIQSVVEFFRETKQDPSAILAALDADKLKKEVALREYLRSRLSGIEADLLENDNQPGLFEKSLFFEDLLRTFNSIDELRLGPGKNDAENLMDLVDDGLVEIKYFRDLDHSMLERAAKTKEKGKGKLKKADIKAAMRSKSRTSRSIVVVKPLEKIEPVDHKPKETKPKLLPQYITEYILARYQ